ncbi:TonB-dependent receptor [Novosphingobium sp. 9]|uniref:TonB-dependent receptor n=1 Tax=Novosphingobium sp. 9 TaxID=2025349 RepID=UPI0021B53717|nr:TonB-dependent receptor [Novosphingobium sp. 9]
MTRPRTLSASSPSFLALGAVGIISSAVPAQAQTTERQSDEPTTVLGGVTVTDTAIDESGYKTEQMDSPKYTAPLVDTPRSITVIPQQVLQDTASTTLSDALRTVPGITMGAGEGGNPLGDRPFIRGFDSQNSLYMDGVRDIGASSRETFAVSSIEVVKGSDSVQSGSGNAGGSINIVSKAPTADRFAKMDATYGSDDYKRVTVDINQPINDFVGVRLNAMYHDQDVAGRGPVFQKRWGIAPSITLGLNGPTSLTLDYYHLHTNELPDSGIPYTTTLNNQPTTNALTGPATDYTTADGQSIHVPRNAYYGLVDRDFRHTTVNEFTSRFRHEFDNGFVIRNTTRYSHNYQEYVWTQPDDSQGNVYNTGTVWRRANTRYGFYESLTNQTDLTGKFDTGGIKHSFSASLEYNWQNSAYGSFVSNAATGAAISTGSTVSPRCNTATLARYYCTTVANPNPYDAWNSYTSDTSTTETAIVKSLPKTQTLTNSSDYSASLFDTMTLTDWLLVNLGGRYDHVSTNASAGLTATSTASRTWVNTKNDLWTYQAGVLIKPASNGSIYFSTAKSAIPPGSFIGQGSEDNTVTTANIDPNDFKVQKTTSYELGTKWDLFDNNLSLSVDVFQTKTVNARTTNPDGSLSYVGTKRVRGAEVSYNGNITPQWNVFGGFVYMPSKVLNAGLTTTTVNGVSLTAPAAATGHPFPNTPKYSFTTFTNYKVTPKLTVGGGAIYMSRVYGGFSDSRTIQNGVVVITKTRATYVPSYWRFDANATYQITDMIGLRVNALNLTNKRYFDQAYATHYAHQAAGRTVMGTLSITY